MMTDFQKKVKEALNASYVLQPDKVTCRKNGSVEVRRFYAMRATGTAQRWAQWTQTELERAGIACHVKGRDEIARYRPGLRPSPAWNAFCAVVTPALRMAV